MAAIARDLLDSENKSLETNLATDYTALGERLTRSGVDIDALTSKVAAFRCRGTVVGCGYRWHPLRAFSGYG